MATIFSRIIGGELPGHFVWRDERCVGFLSINPHQPGHTLVVPVAEIDHWIDLDTDTAAHLMAVGRHIGAAQMDAFSPPRIGLMIAGFEVPHVHIHVLPMFGIRDLDFANAEAAPAPGTLETAAERLRGALRRAGHDEVVD